MRTDRHTDGLLLALARADEQSNAPDAGVYPSVLDLLLDADDEDRTAIAASPLLPPIVIDILAHRLLVFDRDEQRDSDDDTAVLLGLARNPSAPADVLELLAGCGGPWVVAEVAANPSAGRLLLSQLATSDDPHVRNAVAANPSKPWVLAVRR